MRKRHFRSEKGETVSVFGRIAFTYYKSGTGSGGMVNAPYVTNILDSKGMQGYFCQRRAGSGLSGLDPGKSL